MKKLLLFTLLCPLLMVSAVNASEKEHKNPENFKLEAINGENFELKQAKGKYVVLHFLLKTYCPICQVFVQNYAAKADEHPNAEFIFLKPDSKEEIEAWAKDISQEELEKAPTIYRDPNARLAKAFAVPHGYEFHNDVVHYPATIILGPDGKEVFRYVGEKTQDRFTYEMFKEKMEELSNDNRSQ